ncbi:MAG: hypothetical protein AAF202_07360 [Pseudomonadota bacterium]
MELIKPSNNEDKKTSNEAADFGAQDKVLIQLSDLLVNYLEARPSFSLSALSRKVNVSETTLRRIKNRSFKTMPNSSTVLSLITYITGQQDILKSTEGLPTALSNYLKEAFPQSLDTKSEFSQLLQQELSDNTRYLIYKLAANDSGVSKAKIQRLLGELGVEALVDLTKKGLLLERDGYFFTECESFTMSPDVFKDKFQYISQFIKTDSSKYSDSPLRPLHVNYSSSVSSVTYKKIMKIQKRTLKSIRELMQEDSGKNGIPIFLILALDSLDTRLPHEDFEND